MENDTDNDQGDKDLEDAEVREEVVDHEIVQVEEELVQESWSKMKGFSNKRDLQVTHFVDCLEWVLCELCSKQLPSHPAMEKHRKAKHSDRLQQQQQQWILQIFPEKISDYIFGFFAMHNFIMYDL